MIVSSNKNGASALRSNGGDVSVFADQVAIVNEGKTGKKILECILEIIYAAY